jgi:acetyl esterase/lipase
MDIRDAFTFVKDHISEINADVAVKADVDRVFFAGHSAGAAIVSAMMLLPNFVPDDLRRRIRGLVLLGGAYHTRFGPPPPPVLMYYETVEKARENEPLALLEKASAEALIGFPPVLMLVSEKEPGVVVPMNEDFRRTLGERLHADIPMVVMKGHNHTSVAFGLFSGEGEEWAHEVIDWVKSQQKELRSKI